MIYLVKAAGWGLLTIAFFGLGADLLASLEAGRWRSLSVGDLLWQAPLAWRGIAMLPSGWRALPVLPLGLATGLGLVLLGRWLRR